MKHKKKTSKIEKHRGNPHGNRPATPSRHGQDVSDDNLRQSVNPGVSQSSRLKQ